MPSLTKLFAPLALCLAVAGCDSATTGADAGANMLLPVTAPKAAIAAPAAAQVSMRWGDRNGSDAWTKATLAALEQHGVQMVSQVPGDISSYCPAYAERGPEGRRAFWAGLLSAVAKHESTYNPQASGGGGKWLGLMQISPATWNHYGCTGKMMDGADNMACAVKIMSRQVGRDNAVARGGDGWRGVARDWAPMRNASKRADIAAWTSKQNYCQSPV
ncbi:lytic transglycosylase domain-containing protein [Paracoccus zhejiangensis]|uniref:Lytic transglycosylase n=1 Tax=Paracoccus zhejiangensis TaxID=1077935 RepID=A0A2H5EVP9_9RHOB|nr:lytic transglycosylase domain-containing protein [Paracoccus zhejiangensis]AUH63353.1 lytic transglycosylase [Paracoccus zhejiangensis]